MSTQTKTRTGGVLAATCLSTLVVNANTSAVSILLPAISEDTGMSVDTLQWAVTGYSLVGAAVIVTSGALGDVFGRKRIFQLGLALFVVSCVLIALANTGEMVIVGRLIQGRGGVHDTGLWPQSAFGREHLSRTVARSVAVGSSGGCRRGRRTSGRWRLGRHHWMARAVLD